jgi:hypothetical protein
MILRNVRGLNNKEMMMGTLVKVTIHCPRNFKCTARNKHRVILTATKF